ncbi:MAG TPA: hypothetical protein DDY49_11125 [Paenibacillaceae bacterium]|nr:hypothetical protein [Paenibacillaceae bacterium]
MEKVDCYFIGQIARKQRMISQVEVNRWNQLTKDFNEIYQQGFVPGIVSEGLITEVISKELPGVPCVIMQKELVFLHPVHIGNRITAEIEIIDLNVQHNWITQKVTCTNEKGIDVIKGQIVLKLF